MMFKLILLAYLIIGTLITLYYFSFNKRTSAAVNEQYEKNGQRIGSMVAVLAGLAIIIGWPGIFIIGAIIKSNEHER